MIKTIEERLVAIDDIVDDCDLMCRVNLNDNVIADYAAKMRDGAEFPPVDCMRIDGQLFLTDGFHRRAAMLKNKQTEIKARVTSGTYSDARLAAVQSGAHSALGRSNADKRKAVLILLKDEVWCEKSDRWIAQQAGVGYTLVASLRFKASTARNGQLTTETRQNKPTRIGRDGKRRRVPQRKKPALQSEAKPVVQSEAKPVVQPAAKPKPIGLPKEELEKLCVHDPALPSLSPSQAFTQRWGHVILEAPSQRVAKAKQNNLKTFVMALKPFSAAAEAFLKIRVTIPGTLHGEPGHDECLAEMLTADEFSEIAKSMDKGTIDLFQRKLEERLGPLLHALKLLEAYSMRLELHKQYA